MKDSTVPAVDQQRLVRLGVCPHYYVTSKDHSRLWDLAQGQPVVCFADYGGHGCRDVACTIVSRGLTEITARGICYVYGRDKAEFVSQCAESNVEFIEPNIPAHSPPPVDPRFARFGEAMWEYITSRGGDFCCDEISEDILPLAEAAELCCRVKYDPEIHGDMIDAEPGCEIWWWGNF